MTHFEQIPDYGRYAATDEYRSGLHYPAVMREQIFGDRSTKHSRTSLLSVKRDHRLSASLQARLQGHRVQAARIHVPFRPVEALAQGPAPAVPREAEEDWGH